MPIDEEFLQKLRCPRTHKPMRMLPAERLAALNAAIAAGTVATLGGRAVRAPIAEAIGPPDEPFVYPVDDGIPILLADEAVGFPGA